MFLLVAAVLLGSGICLAEVLKPAAMTVTARAVGAPWPVGETVHVCAIRVEFVPDDVTGTLGDGTMESAFTDSLLIDPLPHDRAYFTDHLSFLRHYYETVSKGVLPFGRLDVYPTAEDSVYRVAHPMWHYNYNVDDDLLNRRLTELLLEALELADSDVNFADYDAVIVFHAGVGKDFNLGYDETPFDLPSAYVTPADFQAFLPPDHAAGFQTNDGVVVNRGLLLPEGESQDGYELGLNGIMVKLFGNWLGLPDLFDTETGRSGIGRWGMMDQGSGNVFALVPAMPEAWSRVYMGWEIPDTIWASALPETLRIGRFGVTEGAPEVALFPITDTEYYLIENRAADPDEREYVECRDRQGRRMQITLDGEVTIYGEDFGVVTEADNYDFGIPGAGLLIWHIDETKIQAGLIDNSVNADPEHRGVDLVEADGPQDIGEEYGFGFAGGGTELGAPEDAWWDENDYHKQANGNVLRVAFGNTTSPAAQTYDGAYSWYELFDFSAILPVMSVVLRNPTRVAGFPVEIPPALGDSVNVFPSDFAGDGLAELIMVGTDSTVFIIDSTVTMRTVALPAWSNIRVADIDGDEQDELLLGADRLYIVKNLMGGPLQIDSSRHALREGIYNHICLGVAPDSSTRVLAVWEEDEPGSEHALGLALFDGQAVSLELLFFPDDSIWHISGLVALDPPPSRSWAIGYESAEQGELLVAVDLSDEIEIRWQQTSETGLRPLACVAAEAETLLWCDDGWRDRYSGELLREAKCDFSYQIVDWDGDGTPEVIDDGRACHLETGFPVEGFPVSASVHNIVTADFDGDHRVDLFGDDGRWHLFRHNFSEPQGFPMARLGDLAFVFHWDAEDHIEMPVLFSPAYFSGEMRYLDLRRIAVIGAPGLRQVYGAYPNPRRQDPNPTYFYSIDAGAGSVVHSRSNWVYPWPNPTNDISNIRLTLPYAAQASVRFFDIAGHLIDELPATSVGPGPYDVPWDVSRIASGVYIGIVEIAGNGRTERAQIKIAVVK